MKMNQYQASRAVGAKLRKDLDGMAAETPLNLTYLRSFLDRPRYLGGRLIHEYRGTAREGERIDVRDAQLKNFVFSGLKEVDIPVEKGG